MYFIDVFCIFLLGGYYVWWYDYLASSFYFNWLLGFKIRSRRCGLGAYSSIDFPITCSNLLINYWGFERKN
ncbi:Uncharacterised protein [Vibrio cholerae]|nr:Uncharacterised protein [Vibrio cholerae]CSD34810.1 Uncharacterised protein [Vibrio cholerae]